METDTSAVARIKSFLILILLLSHKFWVSKKRNKIRQNKCLTSAFALALLCVTV